jgi:two-component system, cell cycle sensor histidine kinase and response regulator CckA
MMPHAHTNADERRGVRISLQISNLKERTQSISNADFASMKLFSALARGTMLIAAATPQSSSGDYDMNATVNLDGTNYTEGSPAHLAKIAELHKREIAKHTREHVEDATELKQIERQARVLNEELKDGVREQAAALAEANAAIQESEDRFLRLVKGVKDYALYTLDTSGNIASWNSGAELIEGYKEEEILGKHLSIFYQPADVAAGHAQKNLDAAASTGRAEEEGWRVRKDGSAFWASVVLSSIHDSAGQLIGFAKITRDLTERRRWEEQLGQAQKMEAIGGLAAGVAHDFNNLLSIILSYSELLAADLSEDNPMRADLQEIRSAGLLAATLTRRLLAFGRQERLEPKVVDLCHIVSGMEKMLRRTIGEDIELITNFDPECGKLCVDLGQMEQVVLNLVVNARDAMPDGGQLTIEAAEVTLDAAFAAEHAGVIAGPHVLLSVSDTGVGMNEATLAHMFEPFFTTKERSKGTGLGLATVFGIVKQSGGTVWVASTLGHGTQVKIYLPVVDRNEREPASSPLPNIDTLQGTETILLVEDDESVRVLARTILRKYGYNVLDAKGGGDAFLLCEQHKSRIDLLLTDVVMPRMSGRELAERLLLVRPDMKVLYMSGYTDDAVMRHGIFYSAVAFIQKPITPEALARKVRRALDAAQATPEDEELTSPNFGIAATATSH